MKNGIVQSQQEMVLSVLDFLKTQLQSYVILTIVLHGNQFTILKLIFKHQFVMFSNLDLADIRHSKKCLQEAIIEMFSETTHINKYGGLQVLPPT